MLQQGVDGLVAGTGVSTPTSTPNISTQRLQSQGTPPPSRAQAKQSSNKAGQSRDSSSGGGNSSSSVDGVVISMGVPAADNKASARRSTRALFAEQPLAAVNASSGRQWPPQLSLLQGQATSRPQWLTSPASRLAITAGAAALTYTLLTSQPETGVGGGRVWGATCGCVC